ARRLTRRPADGRTALGRLDAVRVAARASHAARPQHAGVADGRLRPRPRRADLLRSRESPGAPHLLSAADLRDRSPLRHAAADGLEGGNSKLQTPNSKQTPDSKPKMCQSAPSAFGVWRLKFGV